MRGVGLLNEVDPVIVDLLITGDFDPVAHAHALTTEQARREWHWYNRSRLSTAHEFLCDLLAAHPSGLDDAIPAEERADLVGEASGIFVGPDISLAEVLGPARSHTKVRDYLITALVEPGPRFDPHGPGKSSLEPPAPGTDRDYKKARAHQQQDADPASVEAHRIAVAANRAQAAARAAAGDRPAPAGDTGTVSAPDAPEVEAAGVPVGAPVAPGSRVRHGTRSGYNWHYRQPPGTAERRVCAPCRAAYNEDQRKAHARREAEEGHIVQRTVSRGHRGTDSPEPQG